MMMQSQPILLLDAEAIVPVTQKGMCIPSYPMYVRCAGQGHEQLTQGIRSWVHVLCVRRL